MQVVISYEVTKSSRGWHFRHRGREIFISLSVWVNAVCPAVQSEVMAAPEFEWLGIFWDAFIRRYRVQLRNRLGAPACDYGKTGWPLGNCWANRPGSRVDLLWGQIHREPPPNTPSEGSSEALSVPNTHLSNRCFCKTKVLYIFKGSVYESSCLSIFKGACIQKNIPSIYFRLSSVLAACVVGGGAWWGCGVVAVEGL